MKNKAAALWREDMNFLVRELAKLAVEFKFKFWVTHVNGELNGTADALSRFYDPVEFELKRLHPERFFHKARKDANQMLVELRHVPLNGDKRSDPGTFVDCDCDDPWHLQL